MTLAADAAFKMRNEAHCLSESHEGGHQVDAVPKILQADVFVCGVLVVVVVHDRDADQGTPSSCSITYSGTLPPIVGSFTTGPRTFSTTDTTSRATGVYRL